MGERSKLKNSDPSILQTTPSPNFPRYYLQWYILITYTYHSQLLVSVFSQPIILNSPVPVNLDRKSIKAVVQRVYPWILVSGGVATIIIITRQLSYPPLRRLCTPVGRLAACFYVRGEGVEEMNVWTLAYYTGCSRFVLANFVIYSMDLSKIFELKRCEQHVC